MSDQHWIDQHRTEIESFPLVAAPAPECMVAGCTRSALVHSLCRPHFRRARRLFDPNYTDPRTRREDN